MDKVLIADGDEKVLGEFEDYFRKLSLFQVVTASDGESALEEFGKNEISVLVTEMSLPEMGALELLAYMTRSRRNIPCVVMSESGKPWFSDRVDGGENLYYVDKPIEPVELSSAIVVALGLKDEGSSLEGFGLRSFLPLIQMEKRSCRLEVVSKGKNKGYLYFADGLLVDAHFKKLTPEEAVEEMVGWKGASLALAEVPKMRTQKRLNLDIHRLVGATVKENGKKAGPQNARNEKGEEEKGEEEKGEEEKGGEKVRTAGEDDWIEKAKKPPLRRIVSDLIDRQLERYKTIKGYIAAGVVDSNFRVIAGDGLGEVLELHYPPLGLDSLFNFSSMLVKNSETNPCEMITLNTSCEIIQILKCDTGDHDRSLYAVGITEATGNWHFMKMELETVGRKLKAGLKEGGNSKNPGFGSFPPSAPVVGPGPRMALNV